MDDERRRLEPQDQQHHERPLTDAELRDLREVLEADRRMKWVWASARIGAIWIAAVAGTVSLLWDSLVRFVLHIVGR